MKNPSVVSVSAEPLVTEGPLRLNLGGMGEGFMDGRIKGFLGDQKHELNFHYINFTFANLAKLLVDAGFDDVKRLMELPQGVKDASTHRDNHHRIKIRLNVEATA